MDASSFFLPVSVSPSSLSLLFLLFFTVLHVSIANSNNDTDTQFTSCAPFDCGNLTNISYPFWTDHLARPSYCGFGDEGYKLKCMPNQPPVLTLSSQEFRVLYLNASHGLLTIQRLNLSTCPRQISITSAFNYSETAENITLLYDCRSSGLQSNHSFNCTRNGRETSPVTVLVKDEENNCSEKVEIPVGAKASDDPFPAVNETLLQPFYMKYFAYEQYCRQCKDSGGRCGSNESLPAAFACYCRDGPHQIHCHHEPGVAVVHHGLTFEWVNGPIQQRLLVDYLYPTCLHQKHIFYSTSLLNYSSFVKLLFSMAPFNKAKIEVARKSPIIAIGKSSSNLQRKLVIGFGAAAVGIIISCIAFYVWSRRHRGNKSFNSSSGRSFMMDLEKDNSLPGVHLFTYKELEQATNNFDSNKELGDGGFGTVYHGILRDGRSVAVKRLYENNYKRVEQFMNEVSILSRLRHRNLVSLYGCTSRHSRELLLVYEYVPNGTVADHLHGHRAKPGALSKSIRLDIAIETATALSYLHASDTIHRDVKTNNILLDSNFSVKVADFGLSCLFPTDVTHVSTAPQGTPGYVDPEYHQCYHLTDKSDVFSFGVVLIELISSKPAVDITRHRHEINLSNMAINKIKNRALHELVDPSLGFESDYNVRKMISGIAEVAFQCLQNERDTRPSMAQVLDSLLRIQNEVHSKTKTEEIDTSEDDVVLLKSGPLPHSPDCVMTKWPSSSTTH
ncbi:hypothetical protein V6N12_020388 [Hibiscus sabdariffa]|uniref:non-specific serine/threonine protein kinase n=1 Tax=Hibiscus sabdariffa TaxID=183260 RepID=A0ABR2CYS1_9ROSI